MKHQYTSIHRSKVFILSGVVLFSSSCLEAWTIQILNPVSVFNLSNNTYILPDGASVSTFESYLLGTGSSLTMGSLGSYRAGDSDAVIVNLPAVGYYYNAAELSALGNLLNSNTRVLLFSENSSWKNSNEQLASLLGGVYRGDGVDGQTVVSDLFPMITEGVSSVSFAAPGRISPSGSNGHSLVSGDGITLWGEHDNFLLSMDINAFSDRMGVNSQLGHNVANWLSGVGGTPIPECSSYSIVFGVAGLITVSVYRRRRKAKD